MTPVDPYQGWQPQPQQRCTIPDACERMVAAMLTEREERLKSELLTEMDRRLRDFGAHLADQIADATCKRLFGASGGGDDDFALFREILKIHKKLKAAIWAAAMVTAGGFVLLLILMVAEPAMVIGKTVLHLDVSRPVVGGTIQQ